MQIVDLWTEMVMSKTVHKRANCRFVDRNFVVSSLEVQRELVRGVRGALGVGGEGLDSREIRENAKKFVLE